MMVMGIKLPVLPLYAKPFGVGEAALGLMITAFGIGRLLIDIPAGRLADKLGRHVLLVGGPAMLGTLIDQTGGRYGQALPAAAGLLVLIAITFLPLPREHRPRAARTPH